VLGHNKGVVCGYQGVARKFALKISELRPVFFKNDNYKDTVTTKL